MNIDDLEFSQIFNLLLKYGQVKLETNFAAYVDELGADIQISVSETNDMASIKQDMSILEKAVDDACEFWRNNLPIILSQDDKLWSEAQDTFMVFDWSNYFSQAVFDMKAVFEKHDAAAMDIISEELCCKINKLLYDEDAISTLRMVPLNRYRQWKMTILPEGCRYLFPWYEKYSELPETFLSSLAENWKDIRNGDSTELDIPASLPFEMIIYDLQADNALIQAIKSYSQEISLIISVLESSFLLGLWYLSDEADFTNPLPEGLYEKGLIRLAIRILDEKVTPDEVIGQIFWVAFCGTGLSDKQRLENFKWVMPHIEKKCYVSEKSNYLYILSKLQIWMAGESKGVDFAKTVYVLWNDRLNEIVVQNELADVETDDLEEKLINKINQIKATIDSPSIGTWLPYMVSQFRGSLSTPVNVLYDPYDDAGEEDDMVEYPIGYAGAGYFKVMAGVIDTYDEIPAQLSINSCGGKIQLLKLPEDFERILKGITKPYYSFGFSWNVVDEMNPIEKHNHYDRFNREIDDQFNGKEIQKILLVLEFDEKSLQHTMKTFTEWIEKRDVIKPPELKSAIVLYYSTS